MKRIPLPDELGSAFSVTEAYRAGIPRGRLAASDLEAPYRGARLRRTSGTLDDGAALRERCRAYLVVAPAGFAFSHVTAALLRGVPLPRRLQLWPGLDVSVAAAAPQPRGPGIRGHRLQALHARQWAGFPVVDPIIAWTQVASLMSVDELVVAGDYLVRRRSPSCTLDQIRDAAANLHRARGALAARAAALDVRAGTDSPPESWVRLILIRAGLPEPAVGHTVIDADGYFVGTPDLAYRDERIAIEYEGEHHWRDRRTFEDDIIRRELFEAAGWRVIRVIGRHLRTPHELAERVRHALAASPRR